MKKILFYFLIITMAVSFAIPVVQISAQDALGGQAGGSVNAGATAGGTSGGAAAATTEDYVVLAPLPGIGDGNSGGKTTLETYLPNMFNLMVGIAAALAFIMITWGGVMYATSDALSSKTDGKKFIEDAVWGLLLVIGAWIILNTINPQILNFNLILPKSTIQTTPGVTVEGGGVGTSGLLATTEAALNDLKSQCAGCTVRVTSTTGDSHTTNSLHYQGRAFDVAPDTKLDTFVSGKPSSQLASCSTFTKTFGGKQTTFLWEKKGAKCGGTVASSGDHWHVSVAK